MSSESFSTESPFPPEWLRIVQEKVETLRYGVVQLVVHDGRVTQIERTEKVRVDPPGPQRSTRGG